MDDKVGGKLAGPPGSKGGDGPYGVQLVPGYEPIPQGWTRGPVPFGTFIDRQDDGREILSPALGAADRREGRAARPRDLPRLEKRADGGWRGSAGKAPSPARGLQQPRAAGQDGATGFPEKAWSIPGPLRPGASSALGQWRPCTSRAVMARGQPAE